MAFAISLCAYQSTSLRLSLRARGAWRWDLSARLKDGLSGSTPEMGSFSIGALVQRSLHDGAKQICTVMGIIVIVQIIVQDKALDPLLLLSLGFLLMLHRHGEVRVGW